MNPSVLVCNDEPHVAQILALKLDRAGFDVQTAANVDAAWTLLHRHRPSVVILDYHMPGGDGVPFLEQLRAESPFTELPIIMLVPPDAELGVDAHRLHDLGVTEIVRKPFSARRLVSLMREAVLSERGCYSI